MAHTSGRCRQIATAIKDYLIEHPAAADSARGIADWWLPGMGIEASLDEVRAALDLLTKDGTVEVQVIIDGRNIYRTAAPATGASPCHG
jgi:hypothetical protein